MVGTPDNDSVRAFLDETYAELLAVEPTVEICERVEANLRYMLELMDADRRAVDAALPPLAPMLDERMEGWSELPLEERWDRILGEVELFHRSIELALTFAPDDDDLADDDDDDDDDLAADEDLRPPDGPVWS